MQKLFVLQVVLGVFEAIVWNMDLRPYTAHDFQSMTMKARFIQTLCNSVPHFVGFLVFRGGEWSKTQSFYVAYITLFTSMQAWFWWLPYIGGRHVVSGDMLSRRANHIRSVYKVLPPLPWNGPADEQLVPSAEHTLLFPMSVLTLLLSVKAYTHLKQSRSGVLFLKVFGFLFACIPALVAYNATTLEDRLTALLVSLFIVSVTWSTASSVLLTEKTKQK